jgi:DNA-directed RNA polymerase subunit RPC12/RpoP
MRFPYITNMSMYNYERFCSHCDETIEFPEGKNVAKCPNCGSYFKAEFDYSFEEGRYRDCTVLVYTGYVEGREASE